MRLVHGLGGLPLTEGPTAATIGFFDGVHRGHQSVFRRTVDAARERGVVPAAVTFDRHPREILTPGMEPGLLTTLQRKVRLIEALGIEALVVLEFTEEFASWPPEDFVGRILVEGLSVRHVAVGSNFTFGYRALGNVAVLNDLAATNGFTVEGVSLLELDGRPVSSSSIREALAAGDLDWPAEALGRRYAVEGRVTTGAGRGKNLGVPTANLETPPRMLLPAQGVYAGTARVSEGTFAAAINVGMNPTFGREPLHAEAYLLDFQGDLLGRSIELEFWARLRDEVRFDTADDLVRQIWADVDRTRELVGEP